MDLMVKKLDGSDSENINLSDSIFGLEPREDILQLVVRWQLAKRQSGNHRALARSDVSRTGAKMYKQKGTGRARHSSARVSQFRGGGKAHGPVVRSHAFDLPKKVRALGLKHALSTKLKNNDLLIVENFDIDSAKTSYLKNKLFALNLSNALFVGNEDIKGDFFKAVRNIPNMDILLVNGLNVYDILRRDKLVMSKQSVLALEERFK